MDEDIPEPSVLPVIPCTWVLLIVTRPFVVDVDIPVPFVTPLTGKFWYVVADIVDAVSPELKLTPFVKFVVPVTFKPSVTFKGVKIVTGEHPLIDEV